MVWGFITFLVLGLFEGFFCFFLLWSVALRAQNPLRKQIDTPLTLSFGSLCSRALMERLAEISELSQYISALRVWTRSWSALAISQVTPGLWDVGWHPQRGWDTWEPSDALLWQTPQAPPSFPVPLSRMGNSIKTPKIFFFWAEHVLHGVACPFGQLCWLWGDPAPGGGGPGSTIDARHPQCGSKVLWIHDSKLNKCFKLYYITFYYCYHTNSNLY